MSEIVLQQCRILYLCFDDRCSCDSMKQLIILKNSLVTFKQRIDQINPRNKKNEMANSSSSIVNASNENNDSLSGSNPINHSEAMSIDETNEASEQFKPFAKEEDLSR
ncbi:hypothetical protein H312_02082 [Anncaliia algerae PRA339]|uniref:Uncharacterized protein n=1 Tax=Anncaliia algerae PRA339 TaxID=1288291 RepID=A0A059F043_9MICR|nr:hypothetical protein H312_02082 [Anncaliia algerae PRA339]